MNTRYSSPLGDARTSPAGAAIDLFWIPLGAGDHVVKRVGRVYEAFAAAGQRRERCDLYHAALQVHLDGTNYVIESAPAWDHLAPDRGVVAEGPVGLRMLGRSRWFRYEIRCWRDGVIPDVNEAVDNPGSVSTDRLRAKQVLDLAPTFPTHTWGRDELGADDMWNSNSLISWLLASSQHDHEPLPPARGRAPGWAAGVAAANRHRPLACT